MAAFGLEGEIVDAPREEDVEQPIYEVWTDAWPTLQLFLRLENKWNVVPAADGEMVRTGIWFPNIEGALQTTNGFPRRIWPEVIGDLEAMEDAALQEMRKAREARREKRLRELEAQKNK